MQAVTRARRDSRARRAGRARRPIAAVAALTAALASSAVLLGGSASAAPIPPVGPPSNLAAVGPTSPDDGFPVWYKDSAGTSAGLCLDGDNPLCGFLPGDIPDPGRPVSFPDNFPDEAFYMLASSTIDLPTGPAVLVNGLEAAFSTGSPSVDGQIVFGRVRMRINTPNGGHFRVTHPYGVDEFDVPDAGTRTINFTQDVGIGAPGDFTGALGSRINPFLRWDTGFVKGLDGASYLGDPDVEHRVTGSALGTNFFRIEGPNIGGPGVDVVTSDLFTLQGRLATKAGVAPLSTTYTRSDTSGGYLDVFASSQPGQTIQVGGPGVATTTLTADPDGRYFGRVAFGGGDPPASVTVSNATDRPRTDVRVAVTDLVAVTQASYDADTHTLTVRATSSDAAAAPVLTARGLGGLTGGSGTFDLGTTGTPPPTVTVTSARSGRDTAPVEVSGAALAPDPVTAVTSPTLTVQRGQQVRLDGSASRNATGFSWSQVGGSPSVTLTGADTSVASFTAPAGGATLTFRLTVTGPGGPQTADTVVTVQDVAAPVADAGPAQTVLQGSPVTLDGSGSQRATSFGWLQTGGSPVTLTGGTTARPTFTMPQTGDPLTFQLTVTGPGGTDTGDVRITPQPDALTVGLAEFRQDKREWRVTGTASVTTSNTVTVWVGSALGAPRVKLGTATVDALGAWSVRLTGGPQPDASRTVSVESSRGGRLLAAPLVVRN